MEKFPDFYRKANENHPVLIKILIAILIAVVLYLGGYAVGKFFFFVIH